jgi:Nif-specific regulatory protein
VRQLSNFIERLVLLASAPVLGRVEVASLLADRAFDIAAPKQRPPEAPFTPAVMPVRPYLPAKSHAAEDLRRALELSGGNKARAAQQLGLTERQFFYRLKKLGLGAPKR